MEFRYSALDSTFQIPKPCGYNSNYALPDPESPINPQRKQRHNLRCLFVRALPALRGTAVADDTSNDLGRLDVPLASNSCSQTHNIVGCDLHTVSPLSLSLKGCLAVFGFNMLGVVLELHSLDVCTNEGDLVIQTLGLVKELRLTCRQ